MNRLAFIILFLLFSSCQDLGEVDPDDEAIGPTLSSIQRGIFDLSCSTVSCHGGQAGGLNLRPQNAFSQLINVPSENDGAHVPPFRRVVPGSPDSSFLMVKLTGPGLNQGDRMPQVGGPLPQQKIDAVREWIQNGAQNN